MKMLDLAKTIALVGMPLFIGISIVSSYQRERLERRAQSLAAIRDDVCQRMEWDLEALLRRPTDAMQRITYHHLDQGLMKLCFGKAIVVSASEADACWVARGDHHCYLDVARALLDAHRQRRAP